MGKPSADSWFGHVGLMTASAKTKRFDRIQSNNNTESIGVMTFEVSSLMSKTVHLWHSLGDDQIARLRAGVFQLEGIRKLVSDDDDFLLSLALGETMDSLASLARSIAMLQRFDHVLINLINNYAYPFRFQYAGEKMESKVKKMERLVASSTGLYQELEVLAKMEQTLRRMKVQAETDRNLCGCLADFKYKVVWQRQEVKRLRETSLWNRSYVYTVRLLVRSLFTILERIKHVFRFQHSGANLLSEALRGTSNRLSRCHSVAGLIHSSVHPSEFEGCRLPRVSSDRTVGGQHPSQTISPLPPPQKHRNWKKTNWPVSSRSFSVCMVGGIDKEVHFSHNIVNYKNLYLSFFELRHKTQKLPPSTLGAAALALHYANVIDLIEKLAVSPHSIAPDARDKLYSMLPASIRAALRARLKTYDKNRTSSFCDASLASQWCEELTGILDWLSPLAHNMIKWQSERNFETRHLVSKAHILLMQTLHFANQAKSEAAIVELLVGLNYLWRFGREMNAKPALECVSRKKALRLSCSTSFPRN